MNSVSSAHTGVIKRILLIVLGMSLVGPLPATAARVTAVESIAMTVSDLDRSVEFYSRVFGFQLRFETTVNGHYARLEGRRFGKARIARLRLNGEVIELVEYPHLKFAPIPSDSRSNDLWFQHIAIIVSDMDKAYAILQKNGVKSISPAPQRLPDRQAGLPDWNKNAGGIKAFYFQDPDGHPLEILQFPAGKGDPKWATRAATPDVSGQIPVFLGIDHTAIAVSSTDRSLAFYRDLLGFEKRGESENYGPEQERLNNVTGAHLRITGLRVYGGPGIEFLEYLAPKGGRPYPRSKPNDLVFTRTVLETTGIDSDAATLRSAQTAFISPGVVEFPERELHLGKALLVKDPDGHVIMEVEK